jgi:hypothetical protein
MNPEVILISHPNISWHGACDLRVAETGWLLAITRNPVRDGAARLLEEGYGPSTTLIIRDSHDATPEIRTTIREAAKA